MENDIKKAFDRINSYYQSALRDSNMLSSEIQEHKTTSKENYFCLKGGECGGYSEFLRTFNTNQTAEFIIEHLLLMINERLYAIYEASERLAGSGKQTFYNRERLYNPTGFVRAFRMCKLEIEALIKQRK